MHYVYILQSEKLNRYYIGYTANITTRLEFHENSEARKFTYNADDWDLVFSLECETKTQALAIEKHIKMMKSKNIHSKPTDISRNGSKVERKIQTLTI